MASGAIPRGRLRPALAWLLVPLALAALYVAFGSLYRYGVDGPVTNSIDFRAFYCGGVAFRTGGDPYRVEPVRSCETQTLRASGLRSDGRVLPVPFPPYALAFFAAISLLPIRTATQLWLAGSVASLGAGIALLAGLTRIRPALVTLAVAGSVGFASLMLGQIVPLVFLAVVFAAGRARRGDGWGAAIGATVAALEPHLALPLWLGLALAVPAARRPLLVAGSALVAFSSVRGFGLESEFVRDVLPLHGRSELNNFVTQYSASSLVAALRFGVRAAATVGAASYAIMLGSGVALGYRLMRRFDDAAFVALTPVAAVLLGGEFVHLTQIGLALPFALLLARHAPRSLATTAIAVAAIAALAVPWETVAELPFVWDRMPLHHALGPVTSVPKGDPNDFGDVPYGAFIDAFADRIDPRSTLEQLEWKTPTWCALFAILSLAFVQCRGRTIERRADAGKPLTPLRS